MLQVVGWGQQHAHICVLHGSSGLLRMGWREIFEKAIALVQEMVVVWPRVVVDMEKKCGRDITVFSASDDTKKKMYSSILVVGGGLMFHKAQEFLQHRILNKMPPSFRRIIENVEVITRPKVCSWCKLDCMQMKPALIISNCNVYGQIKFWKLWACVWGVLEGLGQVEKLIASHRCERNSGPWGWIPGF